MSNVPQPQDDSTVTFPEPTGRSFSRFSLQTKTYCIPVDEEEDARMQELHTIMCGVLNDGIVIAPAAQDQLLRIDTPSFLDCGVGDGAWVEDILEQYGDCDITGVDIFFGERDREEARDVVEEFDKKRWNMDAPFHLDQSRTRLRPESFDLINSRFLADGLSSGRWGSYVRELKALLKPGGWVQMVELELFFQSDNGRLTNDSALERWNTSYRESMERNGKDPRVGRKLYDLLRRAGFVSISVGEHPLRIGAWDRVQGAEIRDNVHKTLDTVLLWPLLGGVPPRMAREEYTALVRSAQMQLQDDSLKLYYRAYVATGRRPPSDAGHR